MTEVKAYYFEVPSKGYALLIMDDGKNQEIWSGTEAQGVGWLHVLRKAGVEPLVFRANTHSVEGRPYTHWSGNPMTSLVGAGTLLRERAA